MFSSLFYPPQAQVANIAYPPNASFSQNPTTARAAQNDLTGNKGFGLSQLSQYSGQDFSTAGVPAMSTYGVGNPGIQVMNQVIEFGTIFRAEKIFADVLGPNGFAPLTRTEAEGFLVEIVRFEENLPDVRPHRGRVKLSTASRVQRTGTMRSFGNGIEFTYQFLKHRDGAFYLRAGIEQMNNGVIDHLLLTAYDAIQTTQDYGRTLWDDQLKMASSEPSGLTVKKWMERDNMLVGAIQKYDRPIHVLTSYVQSQQRLVQGMMSDMLVVHPRISEFVQLNVPTYIEFFRTGRDDVEQLRLDPEASLKRMINGYAINIVHAYSIDEGDEYPFMKNRITYGEFTLMTSENECTDDDKYYPCFADIYSTSTDNTWHRVELYKAIEKSGRFITTPGPYYGYLRSFLDNAKDFAGSVSGATMKDSFMMADGSRAVTFGDISTIPPNRLYSIGLALHRKTQQNLPVIFSNPAYTPPPRGTAPPPAVPAPAKGAPVAPPASALASTPVPGQAGAPTITGTAERFGPLISAELRDVVQKKLTGKWEDAGGRGARLTNYRDALLPKLGALSPSPDGSAPAIRTANVGAGLAMHIVNSIDTIPQTDRSYAAVLAGLACIKATPTCSAADIGDRIAKYTQHLMTRNILSQELGAVRTGVTGSFDEVCSNITAFIDSDTARAANIFESPNSRDFSALVKTIRSTPVTPPPPTKPIATARIGIEAVDRQSIDTFPPVIQTQLDAFLSAHFTLNNIRALIDARIPLPFVLALVRPFIQLLTVGIIAVQRGAQRVYFGPPVFSWNDDGHAQVVRGVLAYPAGSFVERPKTIFQLPNVLITSIESGWGTSWRKGGVAAQNSSMMNPSLGDMLVLLEPLNTPLTRMTELITAYGNFADLSMFKNYKLDDNDRQDCFVNRDWVRAWYNIKPEQQRALLERDAAYMPQGQGSSLICHRGGSLHPYGDSLSYRPPAGMFADFPGYGPGMHSAFVTNKAPRAREPSKLAIMGK